jgi:hypothetical protein
MIKKIFPLAVFALFLLATPVTARAFDIVRLIDPACLFACDDDRQVINNTNSNNVNSNVNSPNASIITTTDTPNYTYPDTTSSDPLGVTCYPIYSTVNVGNTVIWRAAAHGGNRNYHISWTGTNGLSGTGSSVSIAYNSPGTKGASVTVTSEGKTANANCSTVYVSDNSNQNNDNNHDYDDDRYDDNYSSSLSATCYPNRLRVEVNDTVEWRAAVYGGNGNYRITWSGTNGLSDTGSSASIRYRSEGTKHASIRVTSGSRTFTKDCNTVRVDDNYNNDNDDYDRDYDRDNNYPLTISCSVKATFATVGTGVIWESYVSGGNGRYTYEWRGTDNARGSDRNLDLSYNSPGPKTASVTVRSGGRSITQACSNSILIGVPISNHSNHATAHAAHPQTIIKYIEVPTKKVVEEPKVATTTQVASLFSLSNIPWGWIAFLIIIILFFTVVYLVFSRKN